MTGPFRRSCARAALLVAVCVCGTAACDAGRFTPSPTPLPTGPVEVVDFWASGPGGLTTGEAVQLQAFARFTNRQTVDVTRQATWSTSRSDLVRLASDGVLTAVAAGETVITAAFEGRSFTKTLTVMPEGTFRLQGLVDERFGPMLAVATVEVVDGIGTGLKTFAMDEDGYPLYTLYGVAGPVTLNVSAPGYVTQTIQLTVNTHMQRDIEMIRLPPPADDDEEVLAAASSQS